MDDMEEGKAAGQIQRELGKDSECQATPTPSSVEFIIPSLPPSVNAVYQIIFHQRKVMIKPEVSLWKTQAKECIKKIEACDGDFFIKISCDFFYDFFYQNGKLKKFDTQNLLKVLIDAIAEKNGFDDKVVKFGEWRSFHSVQEMVKVRVERIPGYAI
jgi:Holliday junction resolvase RusA-like endonuclease